MSISRRSRARAYKCGIREGRTFAEETWDGYTMRMGSSEAQLAESEEMRARFLGQARGYRLTAARLEAIWKGDPK